MPAQPSPAASEGVWTPPYGPASDPSFPLRLRRVADATFARSTDNVGLQSFVLGFTTSIRTLHVSAARIGDVGATVNGFVTRRRSHAPLRWRCRRRRRRGRFHLREVAKKLRDAMNISGRHGIIK